MSSGESGDESSGLDSPGPSGIGNQVQLQHNAMEAYQNTGMGVIRQPSGAAHNPHHAVEQQMHQQSQGHHDPNMSAGNEGKRDAVNSMNSVIYPAAALANVPQDVLLSLVQAGHLQVHQGEGKNAFINSLVRFYLILRCIFNYKN